MVPKDFKLGNQVLLFNSQIRVFLGKLKSRFFRSYTVTQVLLYGAIEITHLDRGTFKVNGPWHKPYIGGEVSTDDKDVFLLHKTP